MNEEIDKLYRNLLERKERFMFINLDNKEYVLTKEKSLIPIVNKDDFINKYKDDIYYKTIIVDDDVKVNEKDLRLYKDYIEIFAKQLKARKYDDKYYFGCIAVKTNKGFITTIRGKEDLNEYTLVTSVDHKEHIINVVKKKATLNAPLLDYLFNNSKVKVIVHLHEFDNKLSYEDYAFPGTVRDTVRNNKTSFNIRYHGVVFLFDQEGNVL